MFNSITLSHEKLATLSLDLASLYHNWMEICGLNADKYIHGQPLRATKNVCSLKLNQIPFSLTAKMLVFLSFSHSWSHHLAWITHGPGTSRAHPYFFRCARSPIRAHPGLRGVVFFPSWYCALIKKRRILAFQILLLTLNCPWKINGVKIKSFCRKEKINLCSQRLLRFSSGPNLIYNYSNLVGFPP